MNETEKKKNKNADETLEIIEKLFVLIFQLASKVD